MHRTIDVIVHADGTIEPLEQVAVSGSRRALLTILDEPSAQPAALPQRNPSLAEFFTQLQAEGLVEGLDDIPAELTPLPRHEREALARRIPAGTPLSQIIIEEREENF